MPQYVLTAHEGSKNTYDVVLMSFLMPHKKIPFGIALQDNLV
jgi:hypothetical protein